MACDVHECVRSDASECDKIQVAEKQSIESLLDHTENGLYTIATNKRQTI